jgi:hypothetical protein
METITEIVTPIKPKRIRNTSRQNKENTTSSGGSLIYNNRLRIHDIPLKFIWSERGKKKKR